MLWFAKHQGVVGSCIPAESNVELMRIARISSAQIHLMMPEPYKFASGNMTQKKEVIRIFLFKVHKCSLFL